MSVNLWTADDLKKVLRLYVTTPFGKIHSRNPDIIQLAKEIGRTSDAVALKMVNFASLDPTIDRKGMSNVSKLDKLVWDEFFDSLDEFSELSENHSGGLADNSQNEYKIDPTIVGSDVISLRKSRRGQSLFRRMVLASYDSQCAISGISHESLLVASHIDPWASNIKERLNPSNGICLCNLLDAAFENGLIAIGDHLEILVSGRLNQTDVMKIRAISRPKMRLPTRFIPDAALLRSHREKFNDEYLLLYPKDA